MNRLVDLAPPLSIALSACVSTSPADQPWNRAELGPFQRQVTTRSSTAQRCFD